MAGNANSGNRIKTRSTKKEREDKNEEAAIWMLENPDASWQDFIDWAMVRWDVKRNMANEYRKGAVELVGGIHSDTLESARNIAEASLKRMLRKANDQEDVKLALTIRQELNKITGLYTKKIEINDTSEKPIFNITPIKNESK